MKEENLIVIRREDGVNYIEPTFSALNSIPRIDARRLGELELINHMRITYYPLLVLIDDFKKENRTRKYDKFSNPSYIKRRVFNDLDGNILASKLIYPKLHFELLIPLQTFKFNCLKNLHYSGEVVFFVKEKKDGRVDIKEAMRLYDSIQVYKLSFIDLNRLLKRPCMSFSWDYHSQMLAEQCNRAVRWTCETKRVWIEEMIEEVEKAKKRNADAIERQRS